MPKVQILRDPQKPIGPVPVDIGRLKVALMFEADKSDPLIQRTVAILRVGERLVFKSVAECADGRTAEGDAVAALIAAVIENHAEIRDILTEKP